MVLEYLSVENAAATIGIQVLERLRRLSLISCRLIRPNEEIRVSFAAILAVPSGGRFVLVKNLHRPEAFAPFGGVYKYHDAAKQQLEKLLFRPEDLGPGFDMKGDLRGYLPRRHLPALIKWFDEREHRESPVDCIKRELREELAEIGVQRLKVPTTPSLRKIRRISEGPTTIPGRTHMQYRVLEVFELTASGRQTEHFIRKLVKEASSHDHLLLANTSEIVDGRATNNSLISNHTSYLVRRKTIRQDLPPFTHGASPPRV